MSPLKSTSRFLLLSTTMLLALAGCKKDEDPQPTPSTPARGCSSYQTVTVSSDITQPTTWNSCTVYVVNRDLGVSAPLTIQPGAIVKFGHNVSLVLSGNGIINATGEAGWPVVFTSLRDDARGGDTNADAAATTPAAGDWYSINLNGKGAGSRFQFCEFRYGGGGSSHNGTLDLWNSSAVVENSVFADNKGGAPQYDGALTADNAKAGTVIRANTFYRNGLPLTVGINFGLDDSNVFHNPANAAEKNQYQGIWVTNNNTVSRVSDWTWAETEVPFVTGGFFFENAAWTLSPGVTVKFKDDGYLQLANGARILAQGSATQPVTFTSIHDDATGGDTNANGTTTAPAKTDWKSINLNAVSGSSFDYCRFQYGGSGGSTLEAGGPAVFTVKHSTFAHNGFDSSIHTRAALDAYTGGNGSVIQGNVFYDNFRPLTISAAIDLLDDSNVFHNPANAAEKNKYQGIMVPWDNNRVPNTLTWRETEVAFVLDWDLDLATGKTLTLADNVTLKFYPLMKITLRDGAGQLINGDGPGVTYTSLKDDTRGGDSNGDGAATAPAAGDWKGIYHDTVPGEWIQWANIRHDSH